MSAARLDFRFGTADSHGGRGPDAVVDQIVLAIRSGAYRSGDHLPPARALAQSVGVSQGTVSGAIKILESHGIVKSTRGNSGGIRVIRDDIPRELLRMLSRHSDTWRSRAHTELVQARRAIEVPLAVLASLNATAADVEHMRACLDEMRAAHRDRDMAVWLNADLRFHYGMGHAARSSVLARYQHEVLTELALLVDASHDFQDSDRVVAMHEELVSSLQARDEAAVRALMEGLIRLADAP
ncbi:FCD domain-containing protein [Streptomyces sp. NBC_00075]|uniref:FadR/GntR family transcriptional regulator n=1 Tax=Streptomyces sp. NBC_00075 TaxID=2975641 RepID=UPI00325573EA